jgi:AraC family transcriptional regulator
MKRSFTFISIRFIRVYMVTEEEKNLSFQNSLYFWDSEILFLSWENISWFKENSFHKVHSALIIILIDQISEITTESGQVIKYSGILVPPNIIYKNKAVHAFLLILQIDPDSVYFNSLKTLLDQGITTFDPTKIPDLGERIEKIIKESATDAEVLYLKKSIVDTIAEEFQYTKTTQPLDNRVLLAIDYLKNLSDLTENTNLAYLAKLVGLSPDRFRHLFTENMGVSIRRYILYLRIRKTAFYLNQGMNLTRAAHNSGFADHAHLSRTFREMYGNNPSSMFLRENKIMIHFCD